MNMANGTVATLAELRTPVAREASMPSVQASFFNLQGFELMQRVAKAFAASTLVPKEYVGNVANCMIAINMAQRIGADPMMVMQNLYVVHGRPGWSAQFLIATFNHCGRFSALRYEWLGDKDKDSWGCRAWATEKETGEKIVGPDITIALAKKEQWYQKSGSKWQSIPQLMLMYRAAAWLIRSHAPEIAMGLQTAEELGDTYDAAQGGDGSFSVTTDDLKAASTTIDVATESTDTATGEITGVDKPHAGLTFAALAERFNKAMDVDVLDADATLLKEIEDEAQRAELTAIYKTKRAALA